MPPVRLSLADLRAHPDLLRGAAGAGGTVPAPQAGDPGAAGAPAGQGSGRKGKALRTSRFRLTQPEPAEAIVLRAVLKRLRLHPGVAWVERLNSGAGQIAFADGGKSQWMRFAWRGAPDLIGQLTDGRILCVECKRPSGRLRPDQEAFLNTVRCQGGVAFVARSQDDVTRELK
jgi:hypothetical protein